MKQARAIATTRQAIPFKTILMMVPVIAALSNPSLITASANMIQDGMQSTGSSFAPDVSAFAGTIADGITRHSGGMGTHGGFSSPVFVGGGPVYLPHS